MKNSSGNKEKESKFDKMLELVDTLQRYKRQLEDENAELKRQNQEYEGNIGRIRMELAVLHQEKDNFDAILRGREEARLGLEKEVSDKNTELGRLSESVAVHMHRASETEKEIGRVKEEYAILQEVMAREREAHEQTRKDARALKDAADNLEGRLAESVQAATARAGEIQNLQTEIEDYKIGAARYKETVSELQAMADAAEQKLDAAQSRLNGLERLHKDVEQYCAKIELLEKKLAEQMRALDRANEQITRHKTEYEQSQQMLKGAESMARELGQNVKAQENDIGQYQSKIREYDGTIKAYAQTIVELREDLKKANDKLGVAAERNAGLEAVLKKAQEGLAHLESEAKKLDGVNIDQIIMEIKEKAGTLSARSSHKA